MLFVPWGLAEHPLTSFWQSMVDPRSVFAEPWIQRRRGQLCGLQCDSHNFCSCGVKVDMHGAEAGRITMVSGCPPARSGHRKMSSGHSRCGDFHAGPPLPSVMRSVCVLSLSSLGLFGSWSSPGFVFVSQRIRHDLLLQLQQIEF